MKRIVILFSGRGSNLKAIAQNVKEGILKDLCKIEAAVTNNSEAGGIEIAKSYDIPFKVIDYKKHKKHYNDLLLEFLSYINPDYIVLAGYMKIIPPKIVSRFKNKIINIHPADTKVHQGLNGYKWAYETGLDKTKITVHFVDEGLDTGKIIAQKEVDLSGVDSLQEVEKRGLAVEHKFYSECLRDLFLKK